MTGVITMADLAESLLTQIGAITNRLTEIEKSLSGISALMQTEAARCPNREKIAEMAQLKNDSTVLAGRVRDLELNQARNMGLGGVIGLAGSVIVGVLAKLMGLI